MLQLLTNLLSGLVGALLGAVIYARVALRGIRQQIESSVLLQRRAQMEESIAALTAVRAELEHNLNLVSKEREGWMPLALSTAVWEGVSNRIGFASGESLRKISDGYLRVFQIRACEEANRDDLMARRMGHAAKPLQEFWKDAPEILQLSIAAVDSLTEAINQTKTTVENELGRSLKELNPRWWKI